MGTPTLSQVLDDTIEARLARAHTMLPGKVTKVDVAAGKCDVQPLIQRQGADGTPVTLPVIPNCPITFYRASGGKAAVYLPVAVGDYVEIRFCERSLDVWLSKGGTVDPADKRKHNLSDAVVYPGLYPFTEPPIGADPTKLVIVNDKAKIEMTPDGKFKLQGVSDEVLDLVSQLMGKLSEALDQLTQAQTPTMMGPQTFLPPYVAEFNAIMSDVDELQEKLEVMKGA
jgi:hypothetical protein